MTRRLDLFRRIRGYRARLAASQAADRLRSSVARSWQLAKRAWRRVVEALQAATIRAQLGVTRVTCVAHNQLGTALACSTRASSRLLGALIMRGREAMDGLFQGQFQRELRRSQHRAREWAEKSPIAPLARRAWLAAGTLRRARPATQGSYRIEVATPLSRRLAPAAAGLIALLFALPAFASRDLLNDLIFVLTMLALAQYWNLLAGYAGLVSVGQQAFVGLGGYLLFALTGHAGLDPLVAILLAGLLAGALALPTALVVFRLRGAYFAIGTWVMAEVYRLVFAQFKQLGGGTGTSLPPSVTNEVAGIQWVKALFDVRTSAARDIITYWVALALAVGTIALVYLILRSRHGLALAAIRDAEAAAESVGVDNFKTKLWVYVVTASATGMVGALIYLQKARISPDAAFSVLDWTAYVIFIVVIGGIGTIEGPIVGVLVFYVLQTNLAHLGSWYLILLEHVQV